MQRRKLVGTLTLPMAICLLALVAGGSMAAVFGNDAIIRNHVADTGSGNGFGDINLENAVPSTGSWNLKTWHLMVNVGGTPLAQDEYMDFLVWRPQSDSTKFQLVVRDHLIVTAGNGVKDIPAGADAKTKKLQAGDITGFYTPAGSAPVIAFDYDTSHGSVWDPIFQAGGSTWAQGDIVTYTSQGYIRQYSMNADIEQITAPAPEPASILALASGLVGLGAYWRRRK